MRMRVLPLCHVIACALLFLFSTSCLSNPYDECHWDNACGGFPLVYPFGKYGCGDSEFHLECGEEWNGPPVMNINGDKYRILTPHSLGVDRYNNVMTIINDNLWLDKCNLSGNYSHFWWPGSHFQISADTYTNLTLSVHCNKSKEEMYGFGFSHFRCDDCYYNIQNPEEGEAPFCQTHLPLPVPIKNLSDPQSINQTLLEQGFEITWHVDPIRYRSCGACWKSFGICGYNQAAPFLCYCSDGTTSTDRCPAPHVQAASPKDGDAGYPTVGRNNKSAIAIGCSVGGVGLTAIALVLFFTYSAKRRKLSPSQVSARDSSKYDRKDMEACVPRLKIGNLSIFSYEELRQATNCFHEDNELGDGGFGSVYLGKLREGQIVAVKRLYQDNSRRVVQFINEVAIFSSLNHPHIVRLYGCTSADSPQLLLVYEFVPNGTLENHLHGDHKGPRRLPWNTRLNIAIQTAQALTFLHSFNPPVFHRDVKSSNILLDENFNVKLADFGLCRHVPVNASHVTTTPQGTPGYVDPEYHQYYQLTEKSDVYSFGVVLVEIISAKLAVDTNRNSREINLAKMAISKIQEGALHELVDPQLEMEMNDEVKVTVSTVAELAFRCLAAESDDRPHMNEVVAQLEEIRGLWGVCPPSPDEESVSFPNHKHWRSFPNSMQYKRPIMSSAPNASA